MSQKPTDLAENRNDFIQFIWINRKFILLFTGAATIVSIVVSVLITPLYLSTAIVFPAASSTVSFSEQRNAKTASMDFGEEEQAEQLVQILQSSKIRDRIVSKFNLKTCIPENAEKLMKKETLVQASITVATKINNKTPTTSQ